MAVHSIQGKPAITLYRRLANGYFAQAPVSLLECRLETGRTHQIRVQLESLGFPLLGDPVYRKKVPNAAKELPLQRQALHAYALSLIHPASNQAIQWFRLPPDDLMTLLPAVGMSAVDLPDEPKLETTLSS
jgi:23S rRNA pseudouridine1911/1915/1917 synthase